MSFFAISPPVQRHPSQVVRSPPILIQDKFGNLILCQPQTVQPSNNINMFPTIAPTKMVPTTSINRTDTPPKYLIIEGSDGSRYLSPSESLDQFNLGNVQIVQETPPILFDPLVPSVDEEDDEIPSYILDHMYAKKPREPGMEVKKPVRKRVAKKKAAEKVVVKEEPQTTPEAPKINIIRQRHPISNCSTPSFRSSASRPRILNARDGINSPKVEAAMRVADTAITNSTVQLNPPPAKKSRPRKTPQKKTVSTNIGAKTNNILEECDLPQLGAYVTIVSDDGDLTSSYDLHSVSGDDGELFQESNNSGLDEIGDMDDSSYIQQSSTFELDPLEYSTESQVDDSETFLFGL